jgi:Na/Pi-cotransporter
MEKTFCMGVGSALLILLILTFPALSLAAQQTGDIAWLTLGMELLGGLALFLFGLEQLADGLKKTAGNTLKIMLARLTTNRFTGAITGAIVTGILNSSSITTVLVVGFVTTGIMTLSQSVGVIMGANIGSTVTAQILAFNISQYALLPIAVGFFLIFSDKSEKLKYAGMMLMGMGLVFFGMSVMSGAMAPLRSYEPFVELLKKMENPLLGILAGAVFTGLVQSSAVTVGIAIALASEGFLAVENCILLLNSVLKEKNQVATEKILHYDKRIKSIQRELMVRKSVRLGYDNEAALKTARIEVSMTDKLVRMYSLIKRITEENVTPDPSQPA